MELHKLEILHWKSGARSHGAAVASEAGEAVLVVTGIPLGIFFKPGNCGKGNGLNGENNRYTSDSTKTPLK